MSGEKKIYQIMTLPGVKRDGTIFDGNFYTEAEWCRWQRGRPRKMGGFRQMSFQFTGICRGTRVDSKNGLVYVHAGSSNAYQLGTFNYSGYESGFFDLTPAGLTPDDNNMWQQAVMYDNSGTAQLIIAHAAPNLQYIDNQTEAPVFYGDLYGTSTLSEIADSSVSGGVCVLNPYLFLYSHDGLVKWSVPNNPTDLSGTGSGEARITGGKVVYGLSARAGSGNAPAGIFWATDALIRCTFVGNDAIFNFDRITQGYSIISSQGVVEYDGIYYWPGIDRFLYFDGVIRELPNNMNLNFFFDNLNTFQRQKVFGYKVPRYGEIWWHFPFGQATECNWAVVYNIREKTWYDTPLPDSGRSAGYTDTVFQYPIMFGVDIDSFGGNQLWQHEYGTDKQIDNFNTAIKSFFITADISFNATGPTGQEAVGVDRNLLLDRIEPDFIMSGTMTVTPQGEQYAQGPLITGNTYTFDADTQKIDVRDQIREMRLKFQSNETGGNYQAGQILLRIQPGDGRP